MEISRQSCILPFKEYHPTIKKSIDIFRTCLMVRSGIFSGFNPD
jgi:hypothetical protein